MLAQRITSYMPSKPIQELSYGLHQQGIVFSLHRPSPKTWFTLAQMTVNCTPSTPPEERSSGLPPLGIASFPHLLLPTACFISAQMTTSSTLSTPLDARRPPVYPSGLLLREILSAPLRRWPMGSSMWARRTTISMHFTWPVLLHNVMSDRDMSFSLKPPRSTLQSNIS